MSRTSVACIALLLVLVIRTGSEAHEDKEFAFYDTLRKLPPLEDRTCLFATGPSEPLQLVLSPNASDPFPAMLVGLDCIHSAPAVLRCSQTGSCIFSGLEADFDAFGSQPFVGKEDQFALVDSINQKLLLITADNLYRMLLIRCELTGANCQVLDISAGQSGTSPSAVVDETNAKLLVVAKNRVNENLGLYTCSLSGTDCVFIDLLTSGDYFEHAVSIDRANSKLLIVARNFDDANTMVLIRCNLDGTSLEESTSIGGPSFSPKLAIDQVNSRLFLVGADVAASNRLIVFSCPLNDITSCVITGATGPDESAKRIRYVAYQAQSTLIILSVSTTDDPVWFSCTMGSAPACSESTLFSSSSGLVRTAMVATPVGSTAAVYIASVTTTSPFVKFTACQGTCDNYASVTFAESVGFGYAEYPSAALADDVLVIGSASLSTQSAYGFFCSVSDLTACSAVSLADGVPGVQVASVSVVVDSANAKTLFTFSNVFAAQRTLALLRCELDGTMCNYVDISADQPDGSCTDPVALIDSDHSKLLAVTTNADNLNTPSLFRCELDGSACEHFDVSTGQGAESGMAPTAVAFNGSLYIVTQNGANGHALSLFLCPLTSAGAPACTHIDISAGQGVESGITPSAVVDPTHAKLLVAACHTVRNETLGLYACALDGSACEYFDVSTSTGQGSKSGLFPAAAIDLAEGLVRVVTLNGANALKLSMFSCHLDNLTRCTHQDISAGQPRYSGVFPAIVVHPASERIIAMSSYVSVRNSYTPFGLFASEPHSADDLQPYAARGVPTVGIVVGVLGAVAVVLIIGLGSLFIVTGGAAGAKSNV